MLPVKELRPNPDNPRNNSGAIEKIAASIREFGFKVPLVVNEDKMIVAGHARYMAALMLKLKTVPVVVADDLTEEQQLGFSIAENRTSDFSFFDIGKLKDLDIPEVYIEEFDLESLMQDVNGKVPEAEKEEPEKREGLDLAPFEKYQYVTIICRTTYDYDNLLSRFGLEDIQSRYFGGYLKRGTSAGRIIEYPDFLAAIGDTGLARSEGME